MLVIQILIKGENENRSKIYTKNYVNFSVNGKVFSGKVLQYGDYKDLQLNNTRDELAGYVYTELEQAAFGPKGAQKYEEFVKFKNQLTDILLNCPIIEEDR